MKKTITRLIQGLMLVPLMALGVSVMVPATDASAATNCPRNPRNLSISQGADCAAGTDQQGTSLFGAGGIFQTITNILLFLVGAIAVIMLIIGGIRYVISGGDQNQVTAAKNTILYSIIGIVVAFLAYAAVNFVVTQLDQ